jgi:hypothetical protein
MASYGVDSSARKAVTLLDLKSRKSLRKAGGAQNPIAMLT